jgi:hypothetical protein
MTRAFKSRTCSRWLVRKSQPGADVLRAWRRCRNVPGADVLKSRRRCGQVPAGADVFTAALAGRRDAVPICNNVLPKQYDLYQLVRRKCDGAPLWQCHAHRRPASPCGNAARTAAATSPCRSGSGSIVTASSTGGVPL